MSVRYQRKIKTNDGGHVNVSKSGLSHSQKAGKFTFNSRGTVSFNSSVKGLSFRMNILTALCFIPAYYFVKFGLFITLKLPFRIIKFTFEQLVLLIKFIIKKVKASRQK